MARETVIIHCEDLERLRYPDGCPFNTTRAGKTLRTIRSMGLLADPGRSIVAPETASRETLERFHTPGYLDVLRSASQGMLDHEGLMMGLGTADCPVFPDMYEYPALASGATVTGAALLIRGDAHVVFNPSGGFHHAHSRAASGFCYINDIVLGCLALAEAGKRVMVIDVDVHHCDGVQEAFYDRSDVLVLSLHETGKMLFPGTGFEEDVGRGEGVGYTVNVPLPVGTYDDAYITAFDAIAMPILGAYAPDVIVLELGMDALAGDPLAHLHLTNNGYANVVERLVATGKPILATGGGGYHVENTVRGWTLMWSILCGESSHDDAIFGLGGVMMATVDWRGGLKDRALIANGGQRESVDKAISETVEKLKRLVFPRHGL